MTQLSGYTIKQAKPNDRDYFLKDGRGLFLRVKSNGAKRWVYRFYWNGKQEKLTFGKYPDMGLKTARQQRNEGRERLVYHKDWIESHFSTSDQDKIRAIYNHTQYRE